VNSTLALTGSDKNKVSVTRRFLAILSLAGLAASMVVYVGSFKGLTLNGMGSWMFVLHVGIFVLLIPMYAIEYPGIRNRTFFRDGFRLDKPVWVCYMVHFFGAFFIIHFILFFLVSHGAAPKIVDGKFALDNHGQITKWLTEAEFLSLKGYELRIFATGWTSFYSFAATYWWFPRWSGAASRGKAE
jgi:hypothetical protein